jgi:hypothetical protein
MARQRKAHLSKVASHSKNYRLLTNAWQNISNLRHCVGKNGETMACFAKRQPPMNVKILHTMFAGG